MKAGRQAGFTILELIVAVAIVTVLAGFGVGNVIQYQRTLTQAELDGIAKEIFIAAQNHLTMAESQKFMGVSDDGTPLEDEDKTSYVVKGDASNMLDLMLPSYSLDETVRLGGSYVIRYQMQPALVRDVFYTSGKFAAQFDKTNIDLTWINDNKDATNKQIRGNYPGGTGTAIIGWYGTDADPIEPGKPLSAPTVTLVNAERLYVDVTNPNVDPKNPALSLEQAGLTLIVEGKQSGNKKEIPLIDWNGDIQVGSDVSKFHYVLDDVTSDKNHFYQLFQDKGLYPGEDIVVYVESYNNKKLTNIATSASAETNSLFASLDKDTSLIKVSATAKISNFRHLENLDSGISNIEIKPKGEESNEPPHYYIKPPENGDKPPIQINRAQQTGDMYWNEFADDTTLIYDYNGNAVTQEGGCYFPVTNGGKIEYTGAITENAGTPQEKTRAAKISDVKISVSGTDERAGLFATLGNESTISNLELVNFSVKSENGAAGALAGVVDNSAVQNVKVLDSAILSNAKEAGGLAGVVKDDSTIQGALVHHDPDKPGKNYNVKGKTSVGGLIGEITGACTVDEQNAVEQCAAAVYVESDNGDAGGLIGKIDNTAAATLPVSILDSYAGGHTKDGSYDENYNVSSNASDKSAGGLIGKSEGTLKVENCYSTASVEGATAGGLIGSVDSGGTITNCYVTGYVTGNEGQEGGLAGASESGTTFTDVCYYSLVNEKKGDTVRTEENFPVVVGEAALNGAKAFDAELGSLQDGAYPKGTFNYYATCKNGASPYDDILKTLYNGKYMFRTISELTALDGTPPEWMSTHYGDWPAPETLVINEPE